MYAKEMVRRAVLGVKPALPAAGVVRRTQRG